MKRLLFVLIHIDIGGIEKAFTNLIKELTEYKKYDIDIVLFTHKREFLDELSNKCYIYPQNNTLRLIGLSQREAWDESFMAGIKRLLLGGVTKYVSVNLGFRLAMFGVKKISGYDVAISFQNSKTNSFYGGTNEFVLNKVEADRYCTFIHSDIKMAKLDTEYNRHIYQKFDKVANVSESCRRVFVETWPELEDKAFTVENCCDIQGIRKLAGLPIKYKRRKINFVTVARLDKVKGLVRMVEVFAELKKVSSDFIWHIVGQGNDQPNIEMAIKRNRLKENIVLHGVKRNPYPYIKSSDAFLLVSYQEAAPLVFQEAYALRVPILATNTCSAKEMVEKNNIGIVCENSKEGLYYMLLKIFENPFELEILRKNIPDKNNKKAVEQFISLIED